MTKVSSDARLRNGLVRAGLATILNVIPYAMLTPQVVVRLSESGASATAVSIYGLAPFAVIFAMLSVMPRLLSRFNLETAHLAGIGLAAFALTATSVVLAAGSSAFGTYLALAAILGVATALSWTATEAIVAARAAVNKIGATTALYQTGIGIAFAAGPFVPVVLSLSPTGLIVTTGIIMGLAIALAVSVTSYSRASTPTNDPSPQTRIRWGLFAVIFGAAFVGGWFEVGLIAILPFIALETGLSSQAAVMLVGVLSTGALLSQVPIFFFSDRMTTEAATRVCAVSLLLAALAIGSVGTAPHLLWLAAILAGFGGGALYTLAMVEVGRSRSDQPVAALTSATISAYTFGGLVGPFGIGLTLDIMGLLSLAVVLAILPAAILVLQFRRPRSFSDKD